VRNTSSTLTLAVDQFHPDPETVRSAARALKAGGVAIFPTETVYGIGGDAAREEVGARIFRIKRRPSSKPLTRLVGAWKVLEEVDWQPNHLRLAQAFWPGSLTLILRTGKGEKIGYRWPDHPLVMALLEAAGLVLAATSANLSGRPPVRDGTEAREIFSGQVDLILDGGETAGRPSTVVDLTVEPPRLLRPGSLDRERIENILGSKLEE